MERKKLSDILNGDSGNLQSLWDATQPAADYEVLPAGPYRCRVLAGELFKSKNGTPGYRITLEVASGSFRGRRLWADYWLTAAALPMARRDLAKIGIVALEQLERPVPPGILVDVRVVVRKNDDGWETNRIVHLQLAGIEQAAAQQGGQS